MQYKAPGSYETGGDWITEPGTYHLVVTDATETPVSKSGQQLDAFRVSCTAVEGTVRDANGKFTQIDKTIELLLWNPKLTDKNEGEFARKKQGRMLIALGLINENLKNQTAEIDLADAVGRNIIVTLEQRDGNDDRQYLDIHFADIWHIDDPAGAKFPRNDEVLKMAPASHRRAPGSFNLGGKAPKENGNAKAAAVTENPNTELDEI